MYIIMRVESDFTNVFSSMPAFSRNLMCIRIINLFGTSNVLALQSNNNILSGKKWELKLTSTYIFDQFSLRSY